MLSCFDLRPDTPLHEFQRAVAKLDRHLRNIGLIESIGPIGRRLRHEILDTDTGRGQEFFFITTFRDRAQGDRAVEYMFDGNEPLHRAVYSRVTNAVFVCWEDV